MAADADSLPQQSAPPKRKIRNFLLDARFQLKYTLAVVFVTVVVAGLLGYYAYDFSRGQTQQLTLQMATNPDLHPDVAADLEGWAAAEDREVALKIIGGILVLALALGVTGIVVTHRVVGPAYKLKRLFGELAVGELKVAGRLRKGDELQDVFIAYQDMVESLRERQKAEISRLDKAIDRARDGGAPKDLVEDLTDLRDAMQKELA